MKKNSGEMDAGNLFNCCHILYHFVINMIPTYFTLYSELVTLNGYGSYYGNRVLEMETAIFIIKIYRRAENRRKCDGNS